MPFPRIFEKPKEYKLENDPVEEETRRVVRDHLNTVYSVVVKRRHQDSYVLAPEKVETRIRTFFAAVDAQIDYLVQQEKMLEPSADFFKVGQEFKVMFRRLYQVVTTEDFITAIELGVKEALTLADNDKDAIFIFGADIRGGSRKLFFKEIYRSLHGIMPPEGAMSTLSAAPPPAKSPKVILIIDDAAHSGGQLAGAMRDMHYRLPDVPIVASVGMMTDRALAELAPVITKEDHILYTQKAECLQSMIDAEPDPQKREMLLHLADRYFSLQMGYHLGYLKATHIVTPSKIPDGLSNGTLSSTTCLDGTTVFFTKHSATTPSSLYPHSL